MLPLQYSLRDCTLAFFAGTMAGRNDLIFKVNKFSLLNWDVNESV